MVVEAQGMYIIYDYKLYIFVNIKLETLIGKRYIIADHINLKPHLQAVYVISIL